MHVAGWRKEGPNKCSPRAQLQDIHGDPVAVLVPLRVGSEAFAVNRSLGMDGVDGCLHWSTPVGRAPRTTHHT
eukprot:1264399-Prorocentrum_lima.AAC.1